MKKCPICGSNAFDDATTCYECLYSFETMSCLGMPSAFGAGNPEADEESAPSAAGASAASAVDVDPSGYDLVVVDRDFGERTFSLDGGSLHVGRLPTNEVVLNDKTVSRRHLHVFFESGGFWVEDYGSTNRSTINDQAIEGRTRLCVGDIVRVRGTTLSLRKR